MKKWATRILGALGLLLIAIAGTALWSAQRPIRPVGFAVTRAMNSVGVAFPIAVWYPTSSTPWPTTPLGFTLMSVARDGEIAGTALPLIVLSHGNGGGAASHVDLALALAAAGYVVAAPVHTGDNLADETGLRSATFWSNRNHEVRATVEHMVEAWHGRDRIDATRVGAFGFSAGAFTVLTTVGARPDLGKVRSHCAQTPEFICDVLLASDSPLLRETGTSIEHDFGADSRIKAAVIAAPGLGFTLVDGGLRGVQVPLQLWTGANDRVVPEATNGALIRKELQGRVDSHSVPGAGHPSFLSPCPLWGPPAICRDEGAFDRAAFHAQMNEQIVKFFNATLVTGQRSSSDAAY